MHRRPLPPLTGLASFEAFARQGSMTAAAAELHVTHGAVSRQVRALEARLGVDLVVGPRHDLRLTEAGQRLAGALTSAFDLIGAALPGAGPDQELVLSCPGTLAMKWLIPRLPNFLDPRPGVRVRILESYDAVDFSTGGAHAAIRIQRGRAPDGITMQPFMAHHHGPVLSPETWASCGQDPVRLLALPRLHSESFRPAWREWAERAGVALPPAAEDREYEHNSYLLEAAAAGLGVAVAPWAFAAPDIERGRLVAPLGFAPVEARYALLHPTHARNPLVSEFAGWLKAEAAATDPAPPMRRQA
ncbi:LysR substrate-binding domain-containing protein [Phenylobacterium sp. LjRoot219]|uniref:LysR substrate-binding domain-containing protein n=1 Tax=Phenylobacterium sp. LjRoot219 TaxID=3342283 RepID=UPI003ED14439